MNNQYLTDTNLLQKDNDHLVHILLNPPRHYQLKRGDWLSISSNVY